MIASMVGSGVLNLMKDSLTLIVLVIGVNVLSKLETCIVLHLIMMPLAATVAKSLG